jgi:hypothetical protein
VATLDETRTIQCVNTFAHWKGSRESSVLTCPGYQAMSGGAEPKKAGETITGISLTCKGKMIWMTFSFYQ